LDKDAATYMEILQMELQRKNMVMDKPICFLLNPPYKNTDENQKERESTDTAYTIHRSILAHTGDDAGKERYLGFLSQILNIGQYKKLQNGTASVVMIFTPTSWLIPRPTYKAFRAIWDNNFKFHSGFIVTSNEFFKLQGKWPIAFTIWIYDESEKQNTISLFDLTEWKRANLNTILWDNMDKEKEIDTTLNNSLANSKVILMSKEREGIKNTLNQKMYDFKRDPTKMELESGKTYGGLPMNDERRSNKKTYGISNSSLIGFMDDCTPCRVKNDNDKRLSNKPDRIWFYLDNRILQVNLLKCFNGPTDNRSYCAFDIESAKHILTWFATGKSIVGLYPVWANMFDIWQPKILATKEAEWYALCFAFVLAENRCVVTKFEKDNPVKDAPEVFIDNPLCPTNRESFWVTTLAPFIKQQTISSDNGAMLLIELITELYRYWNHNYCKGQFLYTCGLHTEPYFKYFKYPDFLTPYSGLIQIKKYAELQQDVELLNRFAEITKLTKAVKQQLHKLLVEDFKYFE
jgi:hypothetical protein